MPKTCDTSREFAPGGLVPHNTHLSDLSPAPVTLLIFSSFFHFVSFPWSSISWLLSPHHFTLSLFIYFTLSHRWPLVGSEALRFCSVSVSSFPFPIHFEFFLSFCICLFLSLSRSQVHCSISFILFVSLSLRGQCRVPHLSQCCSSLLRGSKVFNPSVL